MEFMNREYPATTLAHLVWCQAWSRLSAIVEGLTVLRESLYKGSDGSQTLRSQQNLKNLFSDFAGKIIIPAFQRFDDFC